MTAAQSGILTIEVATTDDTGDYLCTAMSEVGVDQESTKITVIGESFDINYFLACFRLARESSRFCLKYFSSLTVDSSYEADTLGTIIDCLPLRGVRFLDSINAGK